MNSKTLSNIKKLLKQKENIMLINHRKMDGDALGSIYSLGKILENLGKQVKYFSQDLPSNDFDFLKLNIKFNTKIDKNYNPDIIICLDTAAIEQLGNIYYDNMDFFKNKEMIVIDHHPSNPKFGTHNLIYPKQSSTCEILYNILKEFGYDKYINGKIATCLLMGIITDTNSFINTNSSSDALQAAGELMDKGASHQKIIFNLFRKKSLNRIKLWGKLLESLKYSDNERFIWTIITNELFLNTKTTINDTSGFVDEFLNTIGNAKVVFLLYELPNGKIKGSFRSKCDEYNVSKFCELFGGGGHARAAGFTVDNTSIYEVETEVIIKLKEFFSQKN